MTRRFIGAAVVGALLTTTGGAVGYAVHQPTSAVRTVTVPATTVCATEDSCALDVTRGTDGILRGTVVTVQP